MKYKFQDSDGNITILTKKEIFSERNGYYKYSGTPLFSVEWDGKHLQRVMPALAKISLYLSQVALQNRFHRFVWMHKKFLRIFRWLHKV